MLLSSSPRASPESLAAQELRRLVVNEMKKSSDHRPKKLQGKSDSLLAEHYKSTNPVVFSRKRSSISAKASSSSGNKVKKKQKTTSSKPLVKSPPISTSNDGEYSEKLKVREKPVTGTRSVRRSIQGGTVIQKPESTPPTPNSSINNKSSSSRQQQRAKDKGEAGKVDEKKSEVAAAATHKKSGAADFLKRMNKTSPVKGLKVVATKSSKDNSKGGKKNQEKKRLDDMKEVMATRTS